MLLFFKMLKRSTNYERKLNVGSHPSNMRCNPRIKLVVFRMLLVPPIEVETNVSQNPKEDGHPFVVELFHFPFIFNFRILDFNSNI